MMMNSSMFLCRSSRLCLGVHRRGRVHRLLDSLRDNCSLGRRVLSVIAPTLFHTRFHPFLVLSAILFE